jgi:hypothetical protein
MAFNQSGEKRAGDPCYADYEEKPVGVSGIVSAGTKRAGDTEIEGQGRPGAAGEHDPGGKWIGKAIKHPGALHAQLGVPAGKKIPAGKLAKAASGSMGPLAAKRANLAKTLKKF